MPSNAKWAVSIAIAVGLILIGWRFTPVLVTLHVLVCLVLVLVIMLQSGNAADLAGAFGGAGSQTAFGPRGAATFLSRATTWCAIVFMMTSLALSIKRTPTDLNPGSGSFLEGSQKAGTAPAQKAPVQVPGTPTAPANSATPVAPAAPSAPAQTPAAPAQSAPAPAAPAQKAPAN